MAFKNLTWFLLVMLLAVSLPTFGASAQGRCSLATLKGTYGGFQQGTIVAQFPGVPFPSVEIGIATYDGAGHFTFTFTANLNGVFTSGAGTGTYDVKPDCRYTEEFPLLGDTAHSAGYIAGAGLSQRLDIISVDPWIVSSGTLRKIPGEGCSLATLKGTFRGITQGTLVKTPPGFPLAPPLPAAMAQSVTYDGAGKVFGSATINFGGIVFPGSPVGTYIVNTDCTYSDSFNHVGVITGAGIMQEVDYIFSDNMNVAVGVIRR